MSDFLEKLTGKSEGIDPMDLVKEEPEKQPVEEAEQPTQEEPEQETPEVEEPVKEEPKPRTFDANHPRFKRVWKELEELRTWKQEQEEKAKQPQPEAEKPKEADMPQEFVSLFGDNPEAWKQMEKMLAARDSQTLAQAESRFKAVLDSQQESAKREKEASERAVQIIEDTFLDLADESGVDFTDRNNTERNQILDICEKYQLFTPDQLPNVKAAYELHKQLYPATDKVEMEEKRKVIAKTNTKTNSSAKESNVFTPSKIKEIEKLGGAKFFMNS